LKAHFESMNVPLIPLAPGAEMLVDEVAGSAPEQVELVLGGEPKAEALAGGEAYERSISVKVAVGDKTHPYLVDRTIKGTPVVPVASAGRGRSRVAEPRTSDARSVSAVRAAFCCIRGLARSADRAA
jgi:hypothetical protein